VPPDGRSQEADNVKIMRIVAVLGVVAAFGLASAPAHGGAPAVETDATGRRSGTFSALTYNVAGLPEGLSGSNPSVNMPLISPLLNDYDLVVVQEDWVDPEPPLAGIDFFHDDLISQVTHPYLSTPATPPLGSTPDRPEALVADGLNRMSQFPFTEVIRVRWRNCFGGIDTSDGGAGDCLSLKGFSVARTTIAPQVEIDVYNLHAEAGSTALDNQFRAEDFEDLAAFVNEYSAGRPIILGGDTNLHGSDPIDQPVWDAFQEATGITDVCKVVECGADVDSIDRFATRDGAGITIEPLTHKFEREKFERFDGQPLSDHDALAVTFEWTAPPYVEPTTTTTSTTAVEPVRATRPSFTG
jgi:hypothetical protein